MTGDVYALVGVAGSDPATVGLDLAGGFAAGGRETVLVELAPGSPDLLDALDLGLEFVFRSTVREVLSGSSDPAGAVTPVGVAHSAVESLGILPIDAGDDAPATLSLDGLSRAVAALREAYDVVVLAVESDGVDDVARLAGPTDRALVVTTPDAEVARATSRLAARLGSAGVEVDGAVVTDCEEEADLWRAKSRLDADVVAVLPPVRPDRVEPVGDRIRELRDELVGADGSSPREPPELDREPPVRSLLALVRGDPTRATITTAGVDGPGPPDNGGPTPGSPEAGETTEGGDRRRPDGEPGSPGDTDAVVDEAGADDDVLDETGRSGIRPGAAATVGEVDDPGDDAGTDGPGEAGGETVNSGDPEAESGDPGESRAAGDPDDGTAFEFGELPSAGGEGDGPDGDADGDPDEQGGSSGDLVDRISEILEGNENGDQDGGEIVGEDDRGEIVGEDDRGESEGEDEADGSRESAGPDPEG